MNIGKINDMLAFFADNVPDLTVTKIMKLFYYSDFISFAEKDTPITNDVYYKLPYGPVPTFIKNEINTLTFSTMLGVEIGNSQLSKNFGVEQKQMGRYKGFVVKNTSKKSNLDNLSSYEVSLIKRVVKKFGNYTAKKLTDQSHKEKPYLLTNENSVIEYKLAKLLDVSSI
ncbi:MAG: Panacea domain-containing protein [Candidatus Moranbacteria bacterium]|nr:Panacea domain-containing protein [Candidatus Moranbacteria bacterium]